MPDTCDDCGDPVEDALARTVQLSVDGTGVDEQRLCPTCFATWIEAYEREMKPDEPVTIEGDEDIIVD
jgi:hypothetical protein